MSCIQNTFRKYITIIMFICFNISCVEIFHLILIFYIEDLESLRDLTHNNTRTHGRKQTLQITSFSGELIEIILRTCENKSVLRDQRYQELGIHSLLSQNTLLLCLFTLVFETAPPLFAFLCNSSCSRHVILVQIWMDGPFLHWATGEKSTHRTEKNSCFFIMRLVWIAP